MTIQRTFFDFLALANTERIHSQMIAWLFADDCMALAKEQKIALFNHLSGLQADNLSNIMCWTEYKSIDIIVQIGINLCVIENKLRSSQHSDQLNRYQKIISDDPQFRHITNVSYCYLTLVKEQSRHQQWNSFSYNYLLSKLEEITFAPKNNSHSVILAEYVTTLRNLVGAVSEFLKSEQLRYELLYQQPKQSDFGLYIESNNLLTILQKAALAKVWEDLGQDFSLYRVEIGETHGAALMDISFQEFELTDDIGQNRIFKTGIQFQGSVAKISIAARDYQLSNPGWIPQYVYKWFDAKSKLLDYRYNKPSSKSFLSISRKLQTVPQIRHSSLELPLEKIAEYFAKEILGAEQILYELHEILAEKNSK